MHAFAHSLVTHITVKAFPSTGVRVGLPSGVRPVAANRLRRRRQTHVKCSDGKQSATKDPAVTDFQSLLTGTTEDVVSAQWMEDLKRCGQQLTVRLDELRHEVLQKSDELKSVEDHLRVLKDDLNKAREIQTSTEGHLKQRSHELELLKGQLQQLHKEKEADATVSMERYRELETALASVESELHNQSENMQSKDTSSPVDGSKLSEIVQEQDAVFHNLKESLKMAAEEKEKAENVTLEAQLKTEEMERQHTKLQQDQELLSKELGQLQILYAEKEMEWMNDVRTVQDESNGLKEEVVGLEVSLATKDRKLNTLQTSLHSLKSDFEEATTRLTELRREVAELRSVNETIEAELKASTQTPEQQDFTRLKSQLTRLQVRVPVLEGEIEQMIGERKKEEEEYDDLEKEYTRSERKNAQLEQRATILQMSMEEKSNRLMAAYKDKKTMKSEADRVQRESATLRQRLSQAEKEFEKYKIQMKKAEDERMMLQREYHEQIVKFAERQQEAQKVIAYHQEHQRENRDLSATINRLMTEVDQKKNEIQEMLQVNESEKTKAQSALEEAEEAVKEKEVELMAAQEEKEKLESKLVKLKESSEEAAEGKAVELETLKQQLLDSKNGVKIAEANVLNMKNELAKFHNELTQRQRIISVRDQEIVTLKDDARLANERVEALRGQITSMQSLNREMEEEMTETDSAVSKLHARIHELQQEAEEKQKSVNDLSKTIADLETKGKQSMEQFSTQIESLEEYSKQQEALVESFFEEKKGLEESVSDLKAQLAEKTETLEASQTMYDKTQNESSELKMLLEKAQLDLKEVKASASAEIEEAAAILAKAESLTQSVQGKDGQTADRNGSDQAALMDRIQQLEDALKAERQTTADSVKVSEGLKREVEALKQQLTTVKEMEAILEAQAASSSDNKTEHDAISLNRRLSQSLAAEEAALSEVHRLREELKAIQSTHSLSHNHASMLTADGKHNELNDRVRLLETENEKLRQSALKRNQILAQSRNFIEQYLDRSVNSLDSMK